MGRFVWNKRNKRNDHCSLTQEQQKCLLFLQRPTLHLHQCEPFEMVQLFVTPRSVHRILQARILEWVLWRTPILDLWRRSLLQGIFLTQRSNSGLLHCRQILYHLSDQGNPIWNGRICQKSRKITEAPPLPKDSVWLLWVSMGPPSSIKKILKIIFYHSAAIKTNIIHARFLL